MRIFKPMPSPKLPPLNALRAFEAAARHLSMKEAGEELHVTPGAVSHMVRSLEEFLGVRLFRRFNRRLALTDAGQAYLPPLRNAFRQIAEATRRIVDAEAGTLTISVAPAFGGAWLVPRLGRFRARHPEIDLRIISTTRLADFDRDGVDLAIRHGLGRYPGLHSERIAAVELVSVCAPAVLNGRTPRKPADLLKLPLLHDHDRSDWPLWFAAHGVTHASHLAGPSFNDLVLLVHAAVAGQGVALVPAVTVERELNSGALVQALKIAWPLDFAYWAVSPTEAANRPKVAAFREWLLAEAATDRAAAVCEEKEGSRTR
jgi:LysR family glycine cleavage system transcriptional activator